MLAEPAWRFLRSSCSTSDGSREKGLDLLFDAVAMTQARLAMVRGASSGYPAQLRLVVVAAGLHERAARTGARWDGVRRRLTGALLSRVYASAELFGFTSTTDTFGNVLLEAMARGLAVVAVDAPPTVELLGAPHAGA